MPTCTNGEPQFSLFTLPFLTTSSFSHVILDKQGRQANEVQSVLTCFHLSTEEEVTYITYSPVSLGRLLTFLSSVFLLIILPLTVFPLLVSGQTRSLQRVVSTILMETHRIKKQNKTQDDILYRFNALINLSGVWSGEETLNTSLWTD